MVAMLCLFKFLSWSIALIYLLVGPAYRLSLMGAFTAPLISIIQVTALLAPIAALGAYALLRRSGHPGYAVAIFAIP